MRCVVALLFALLLSACLSPLGVTPTAAPTTYGTIVGYTESDGHHVTDIDLFDKPAGAPGPYHTVVMVHEGQRVGIIEQHSDGTVLVRTADGAEGWTQIDAIAELKPPE